MVRLCSSFTCSLSSSWLITLSRWVGAFNAISAFNNSGMSLLDANMVSTIFSGVLPLLNLTSGSGTFPVILLHAHHHGPPDLGRKHLVCPDQDLPVDLAPDVPLSYPVFLRLIIWTMRRLLPFTPYAQEWTGTFQFLLDHPRRCYTNLFPAPHTWWLLFSIVALNGIDTVAFVVLNVRREGAEPPSIRVHPHPCPRSTNTYPT